MYLKDLIAALKQVDPTRRVRRGFHSPHSYRGYYDQLAFEPAENITVGEMLRDAQSALGQSFMGYKGGSYLMDQYTEVWLAEYGDTGESIGPTLLSYMLEERAVPKARDASTIYRLVGQDDHGHEVEVQTLSADMLRHGDVLAICPLVDGERLTLAEAAQIKEILKDTGLRCVVFQRPMQVFRVGWSAEDQEK